MIIFHVQELHLFKLFESDMKVSVPFLLCQTVCMNNNFRSRFLLNNIGEIHFLQMLQNYITKIIVLILWWPNNEIVPSPLSVYFFMSFIISQRVSVITERLLLLKDTEKELCFFPNKNHLFFCKFIFLLHLS